MILYNFVYNLQNAFSMKEIFASSYKICCYSGMKILYLGKESCFCKSEITFFFSLSTLHIFRVTSIYVWSVLVKLVDGGEVSQLSEINLV